MKRKIVTGRWVYESNRLNTSSTGDGTDELWGIEGIQFADGMVGFEKKEALIDLDGDGYDVGSKSGTTSADTLKAVKWIEDVRGR